MHRYFTIVSSRLRNNPPVASRKGTPFVEQLYTGEPKAWRELVDGWSPRLYNYLIYNAINEREAQKILNAIFREVVDTVVGSLRVANLAILLFSIAYHYVLHYRRQHPDLPPPKQRTAVRSAPGGNDQGQHFFHTFYQCATEVQQILLLHYLCGVTLEEIAQIVGQSEESLRRTLAQTELRLQP